MNKVLGLLLAMHCVSAIAAAQGLPGLNSSSRYLSAASFSLPAPRAAASPSAPRERRFENSHSQLAFGYSYTRFSKFINGQTATENGINTSIAYFFKDSLAIEGETSPGFGSVGSASSNFIFYGGGVRLADRRGGSLEPWAHALFGGARFHPRTAAGLDGVGYEAGGGVDWRLLAQWSVRVQADWIGTHLFGANQNSVKIASGIVFNF